MKYTVVWQPAALNRLAELWNAGPDRANIATAANRIDQTLQNDASSQGYPAEIDSRLLVCAPLAVYFTVSEKDCLASVYAVWRWLA